MAGWQSKSLAEVCQFINRGISPTYLNGGGIAVLNQKCVRDHVVNFDLGRRHDSVAKKVAPERFLRSGDVLVNSTGTGTLGRVAQLREDLPEPTTVDSHVTIVRPTDGLFYPEFFGYALVAIEAQIQAGGEGCGGQTELSRAKLAEGYHVSFPSDQNEQRRIVAILDEAFEAIATAKANAEKNLQNARDLFATHLQCIDGPKVPLGDLVKITTGKLDANAAVEGGEYPFFTCAREIYAIDEYAFDCEALLLAGNNAVGDFNVKHYEGQFNAYQRTYVITVNSEKRALCRFLYYELLKGLARFKVQSVGAGTKFLKIGMIKELQVSLPGMAEQHRLAALTNQLREELLVLEGCLDRKLAALDELKKSLLHQAFTGQL